MDEYAGEQCVGVDLHRRRRVIVRMTPEGERLGPTVRIDNDPFKMARLAAERPEVVLEATFGTAAGSQLAGVPRPPPKRFQVGTSAPE